MITSLLQEIRTLVLQNAVYCDENRWNSAEFDCSGLVLFFSPRGLTSFVDFAIILYESNKL